MVYHDAELRDWVVCRLDGFVVIVGRIFTDKKQRWPDGRLIQTSPLLTPTAVKEGNVIATLNSYYLLMEPQFSLGDEDIEKDPFELDQGQWDHFAKVLARPRRPNGALRKLARAKALWA